MLLASLPAAALPVDGLVDLTVGDERFLRFTGVAAADTDAPAIATAELLPSGEVLVSARGPGRALLLLATADHTAVWRLRVRETGRPTPEVAPSDEARKAATKACPRLKEEGGKDGLGVTVVVPSASCRLALKRLFEADVYRARLMELTFTTEALQDQLADLQERLRAHGLASLKTYYAAATLVVEGTLPRGGRARLAQALFEAAVGRVPADLRAREPPAEASENARPPGEER